VGFRALEIMAVFRNFFLKKTIPLSGAPAVRLRVFRSKPASVYQYFEGNPFRAAAKAAASLCSRLARSQNLTPGKHSGERAGVAAWGGTGRTLSATERYAIAKMALFQASTNAPRRPHEADVRVRAADVTRFSKRWDWNRKH
jgi:hypothetical protein